MLRSDTFSDFLFVGFSNPAHPNSKNNLRIASIAPNSIQSEGTVSCFLKISILPIMPKCAESEFDNYIPRASQFDVSPME